MSHFVRSSKYRHVYVQAPRTGEAYSNIRLSTAVGEQNYVKANPKYFAVALSVRVMCMCGWVDGLLCMCKQHWMLSYLCSELFVYFIS